MQELGIDIEDVLAWFPHERESPYVLVRVPPEHASRWAATLRDAVRRCYLTDQHLQDRADQLEKELQGTSESRKEEIIASNLPDPGSTMAGDFGEIIIYLYQAAKANPAVAFGPKKWRLKQDRTKPAPYSDVVQFILPNWPTAGEEDEILCAEVKLKSTDGNSSPIEKAIEGCANDRTSRLAKTLLWLKDRALNESLGTVKIEHLDRFIKSDKCLAPKKTYRAVAVICSDLVDAELTKAPASAPAGYTLVVVAVPNLHAIYNAVFDAAKTSTLPQGGAP